MARIVNKQGVVRVIIKDTNDKDTTLCLRNGSGPPVFPYFGTEGRFTCNRIVKLPETSPDGAKTVVEVRSEGQTKTCKGRSKEPADVIVSTLEEAGFPKPEVVTQSRFEAWKERAHYKVGMKL